MKKTICLLPGDGIGPEIVAQGVAVLEAVAKKFGHEFDFVPALIGGAAIDATGEPLPAATVEALPIDLFAPGNTPIAANYTENGYRDDTIIVELEQKRMYDSDVFIAYVKIATPSQLRTAVAGQKIGSSSTNHTSTICQNYNGIVAINGDYFTKTKAGYIVRMGETYREKTSANMDLLLIDELDDFHIC